MLEAFQVISDAMMVSHVFFPDSMGLWHAIWCFVRQPKFSISNAGPFLGSDLFAMALGLGMRGEN